MIINVLNTLAPIALLIMAGVALRRTRFAATGFFLDLNRLVYWVALPALLFEKTSQPIVSGDEAMRIFGLLLAVTFACVLLGYLVVRLSSMPAQVGGVFVQGAFRGNLAYIGLPVLLFSLLTPSSETAAEVERAAVLALAPLIPIYNILAVLALLGGRGNNGLPRTVRATVLHMAWKVATNPLLLACVAGSLIAVSGITLPAFAHRGLTALGQMALPLSLLAIGASLSIRAVGKHLWPAFGASSVKVFIAPLLGFLLADWFGLTGLHLRAALIFTACPTAVASYVMAEQLGGDADLAAAIVVLSTMLALPGLALVLMLA